MAASGYSVRRCGSREQNTSSPKTSGGDIDAALANSVVYLEAFGDIVVAWIWLQQVVACVVACNGQCGDFYDGKRHAARYFFRTELPKTGPALDLLASLDRTTLEMRDGWF